MSSSTHRRRPRFLLDENVRVELARFLTSHGFNVVRAPTSAADSFLASLSKKERRVLVTNDADFRAYSHRDVFSVVLLKIPQHDPTPLIASFAKLLREEHNLSGRLIVLQTDIWSSVPLGGRPD